MLGDFSISRRFTLPVETPYGKFEFECTAFQKDGESYVALKKEWGTAMPLVRIQSACTFGHTFGSAKCNCAPQLEEALARIGTEGGMLVYALHQDGRGVTIISHANSYALQEDGLDTVESYKALGLQVDLRNYMDAAKILKEHYNVSEARVMTNNPEKFKALENAGVAVAEKIPALVPLERLNKWRARQFLAGPKMGHTIPDYFLAAARQKLKT